jgi:hypothetical protein
LRSQPVSANALSDAALARQIPERARRIVVRRNIVHLKERGWLAGKK